MWKSLAVLLVLMLGLSNSTNATPDFEAQSLNGLEGVAVVVEEIDPDTENAGFTKSSLKALLELELKTAGVRLLTEEEYDNSKAMPNFTVDIVIVSYENGLCAFSMRLVLRQFGFLANKQWTVAETWKSPWTVGLLKKEELGSLKDLMRRDVQEFAKDFLSVNSPSRNQFDGEERTPGDEKKQLEKPDDSLRPNNIEWLNFWKPITENKKRGVSDDGKGSNRDKSSNPRTEAP